MTPDQPTRGSILRATKMVGGGRALGHAEGATWMVRGALAGELVRADLVRRRGRVIEAEAIEIVDDHHPARLENPCPHAPVCGGCDWPHVDAAAGAMLKVEVAAESTGRRSELSEALRCAPVTPSSRSYRHRTRLHWDPVNTNLGFYGHRSRQTTAIPSCRILTDELVELIPVLSTALASRCPVPVDVELLSGDDGVVGALAPDAGRPGTVDGDLLPGADDCPGLAGLHRLSSDSRLLRGWGRTEVVMAMPVPLAVPIGAFFQGNAHLASELFRRVAELIGPGPQPVFDLHGGVGFLAAAASCKGRLDITVVEPHVRAAAAARRNLPAARVVTGSAEDFIGDEPDLPRTALVILDPPRSGLTRRLRALLADWRPARLVSLGCDPATWSRDVTELVGAGYRLRHVELFDLFPFTHHVEIVSVLETE